MKKSIALLLITILFITGGCKKRRMKKFGETLAGEWRVVGYSEKSGQYKSFSGIVIFSSCGPNNDLEDYCGSMSITTEHSYSNDTYTTFVRSYTNQLFSVQFEKHNKMFYTWAYNYSGGYDITETNNTTKESTYTHWYDGSECNGCIPLNGLLYDNKTKINLSGSGMAIELEKI